MMVDTVGRGSLTNNAGVLGWSKFLFLVDAGSDYSIIV